MTYEDWFQKGDNDLKVVEILLHEKDSPNDVICFHSQQAVEKYLKGYLVKKEIEFKWVHSLFYLLNLCKDEDSSFDEIKGEIRILSKYSVTPRYPTDVPIEYSREEAKKAFEETKKVIEFVKSKNK